MPNPGDFPVEGAAQIDGGLMEGEFGGGRPEFQVVASAVAAVAAVATDRHVHREGSAAPRGALVEGACALKGDQQRCLAAGMDDYISKPVNADERISMVERLVEKAAGQTPSQPSRPVRAAKPVCTAPFDPALALQRCAGNQSLLGEMIRYFFDEMDALFPLIHAASQKEELAEVGRLVDRMKGTLVYLGAAPALAATSVAEHLVEHAGDRPGVDEAVRELDVACEALKSALVEYQNTSHPSEAD